MDILICNEYNSTWNARSWTRINMFWLELRDKPQWKAIIQSGRYTFQWIYKK